MYFQFWVQVHEGLHHGNSCIFELAVSRNDKKESYNKSLWTQSEGAYSYLNTYGTSTADFKIRNGFEMSVFGFGLKTLYYLLGELHSSDHLENIYAGSSDIVSKKLIPNVTFSKTFGM